jgi:TetR/AcrR family transcriptional regulator
VKSQNDFPLETSQTGSGPNPQPDIDDRARSRLIRAAVEVFDRKGYAAASVREIVEQANLAKPALYYHFGSKAGILLAILEAAARDFGSTVARVADRQGTARERMALLAEEVFDLFRLNVPVVRVAHAVYYGPPEAAPAFDFGVFQRSFEAALRRMLEDGIEAGELRRVAVEDLSLAVMGVIVECTDRELRPGGSPVGIDTLRRVLDLVFEGVLAGGACKESGT